MALGERIKRARLEAGLSQRQLCGEKVTRNMLSQIENGAAQPSMATLSYFAARLGRPISFFLEEDTITSPNQDVMARARAAVLDGRSCDAQAMLEEYCGPDEIFEAEYQLLFRLGSLDAALEALNAGKNVYAAEMLETAGPFRDGYCAEDLERRRLVLLSKARPQKRQEICEKLPSLDEELLLRARAALDRGEFDRCTHLLEAAQDHQSAKWNFLRGEVYLALQQFADAAACYHKAEENDPEKTAPRLERCYRELEDFKQAYFYAARQREL